MKNLLKLFYCFMLILQLAACAQTPAPQEPPETTETPAATPEPQQPTEAPTPEPTPEPVLLGSAETELLDQSESRLHNISLAIESIDGLTLAPGESFSFNETVGERSPERGYEKAAVLVRQEKVQDYGGGVCQVSTTLFQAARNAGLSVLERHSHQKDVGYAHQGDDAAVDYGNKDMRFENTSDGSIEIMIWAEGGVVGAELYQVP